MIRAMHAITNVVQNGNAPNVKKDLFESLLPTMTTTMKMKSETTCPIDPEK